LSASLSRMSAAFGELSSSPASTAGISGPADGVFEPTAGVADRIVRIRGAAARTVTQSSRPHEPTTGLPDGTARPQRHADAIPGRATTARRATAAARSSSSRTTERTARSRTWTAGTSGGTDGMRTHSTDSPDRKPVATARPQTGDSGGPTSTEETRFAHPRAGFPGAEP
jgi:hypothetical protein